MSGTQETAHFTKEDVRKLQQQESKAHGGDLPANSYAAGVQVSKLHNCVIACLTDKLAVCRRLRRQEQGRYHC